MNKKQAMNALYMYAEDLQTKLTQVCSQHIYKTPTMGYRVHDVNPCCVDLQGNYKYVVLTDEEKFYTIYKCDLTTKLYNTVEYLLGTVDIINNSNTLDSQLSNIVTMSQTLTLQLISEVLEFMKEAK